MARVRGNQLDDIALSGDFSARPPALPADLDALLAGCELSEQAILARVEEYYERVRPEVPGVAPSDWVAAILKATATEVPA